MTRSVVQLRKGADCVITFSCFYNFAFLQVGGSYCKIQQTPISKIVSSLSSGKGKWQKAKKLRQPENRIQGKCLEGIYVTTTPLALQACISILFIKNIESFIYTYHSIPTTVKITIKPAIPTTIHTSTSKRKIGTVCTTSAY